MISREMRRSAPFAVVLVVTLVLLDVAITYTPAVFMRAECPLRLRGGRARDHGSSTRLAADTDLGRSKLTSSKIKRKGSNTSAEHLSKKRRDRLADEGGRNREDPPQTPRFASGKEGQKTKTFEHDCKHSGAIRSH